MWIVVIPLRGRSQTTFTRFGFFTTSPLCLQFLWYKSLQKVNFFDHLPPSSCKRSLWTAPEGLGMKKNLKSSYILRSPQNFAKSSPCKTKVRWRFRKILWPSQNLWTLQKSFDFFHYGRAKGIKDSYAVRLSKYIPRFSHSTMIILLWSFSIGYELYIH